ncbi:AraC-type DNA-binding protein [Pedobacter westerhofensis]|uniref:AraC-type DNA-binding protein n=1 Tax=Pedobacter westerhofensis TaxID=425512 RepID=A0A521CAE8_9SPHI|nr:AraC family transcriptional regulator [Pedobacter westerhofensis]SMO56344.1 AraC-type DNA-binding protein [Pedobacter westerhofensis]
MNNIIKEITPLTHKDCFSIFSREKKSFDFPVHFHEEFELNLIINGAGAKRIVGDHEEEISDIELVLVGPNLSHGWQTYHCKSDSVTEVTIQWHKNLFEDRFLKKNQMILLREMLERSARGILFSEDTAVALSAQLMALNDLKGFTAVMELINILHELSIAENARTLSRVALDNNQILNPNSRRIDKAFEYMNANYQKQITLKELAQLISMTDVSFSRFISKRTGNTFVDTLNEIRLAHATRMLIETNMPIADISVNCGFNNISNFNRIFKKKKFCTPKEFRENFCGTSVFI